MTFIFFGEVFGVFNFVLLFIDVFTQPPPPGSKFCLFKSSQYFSIPLICLSIP